MLQTGSSPWLARPILANLLVLVGTDCSAALTLYASLLLGTNNSTMLWRLTDYESSSGKSIHGEEFDG